MSGGEGETCGVAVECAMDEVAFAIGVSELTLRRNLLSTSTDPLAARTLAVVNAAAATAGWETTTVPAGHVPSATDSLITWPGFSRGSALRTFTFNFFVTAVALVGMVTVIAARAIMTESCAVVAAGAATTGVA